ncbi:MAG: right-handed parallel beta-helix repeat-containing protein, partial [Gammaproteobacteria bacterium]|nr:right-handed parallel beta-helix repeat-containing protein [Gammaproteobacteria bacterium]
MTQCQIFNNDKGIKVYPSSSTSQKISNNTIQSNRSDGIYINYSRTGIEISNNQIKSNNGHGIYLDNTTNYTSNRLQLVDNIISQNNEGIHAYRSHFNADNNTISYNQSYAIYSYSSSANVSVTGCLITQNGKGICKNNSGSFNVSNCTISQNSDYAIKSIYATATIQNNVIASNQVGSAVVDLTDNASSKLEYNLIYNNVSSNADATAIHLDGTITCQYNSIRNNQTTYDLHFSGANTKTLTAENNDWGTTDEAQMADRIFDFFDDASKGVVDYKPYLTEPDASVPPVAPTNFQVTATTANSISVSWQAATDADVVGYLLYWRAEGEATTTVEVGTATAYTLSSLLPGRYYISVVAKDSSDMIGARTPDVYQVLAGPIVQLEIISDFTALLAGDLLQFVAYGTDAVNNTQLMTAEDVSWSVVSDPAMGTIDADGL